MSNSLQAKRAPGYAAVFVLLSVGHFGCAAKSDSPAATIERERVVERASPNQEWEVDNPDYTPVKIRKSGKVVVEGDRKWKEFTTGIGGVGRQGSLPINHPPVVHTQLATHMKDDDHVVGVVAGEDERAYPWWVISNGHVVNDMIGGRPIFVAVCEACSGISAFYTEVEGMPLDFRMRGLHRGTWFPADYQTGSYWHSFTGKAWRGPLKGKRMERLQTFQARWGDWKRDHPNSSVVLGSEEQRRREHSTRRGGHELKYPNAPGGLDPRELRPTTRNPKRDLLPVDEILFGLIARDGRRGRAYPLARVRAEGGLLQDEFDGRQVVLVLQGEFQVGAFELPSDNGAEELTVVSTDPLTFMDQEGHRWNLWGRSMTTDSPEESDLTPAEGYLTEWYEWLYSFPETELFEE